MRAVEPVRACVLKNIDRIGSFDARVKPSVLQTGPIYNFSTHGERAIQAIGCGVSRGNASIAAASTNFEYLVGSDNADLRGDVGLAAPACVRLGVTVVNARATAGWSRTQVELIKGWRHRRLLWTGRTGNSLDYALGRS